MRIDTRISHDKKVYDERIYTHDSGGEIIQQIATFGCNMYALIY